MAAPRPKLVVVDANSLLYRAFFALPALTTADGTPTNAVYGFTMMLLRVLDDLKPTHIAAAFDTPKPTFRHARYQAYKGTRAPTPDGSPSNSRAAPSRTMVPSEVAAMLKLAMAVPHWPHARPSRSGR